MSTLTPASTEQPLLRPLGLGDLRLPNRTVMAPATRARAAGVGLVPTELHAAYYAQRAGAGLIVTEGTWVSERAVGFAHVPGVYSEEQVAGWRRVTDVVHCLGGRIVLQLWHTGAASHPDHLGGRRPLGPSAVDPRETSFTAEGRKPTVTPRAMTPAEIEETVAEYGTASANARRAGFDGVEVHAVGSYLIPQFLNPRLNRRTDGYGGTPARRRRFLTEVVAAAAAPWPGRRVGVRLSPYWTAPCFAPDARTLAEFDGLVDELNGRPLAYLHLRGRDPSPASPGPDVAALERYRRLYHGPLIANNGFDRASGNALIAAGTADAVSFATHFIANPDLVSRFALGQELAAGDPATYYRGGAEGYVDYPVCAHWAR
ncbi:alkene reductase [Streptomyces caatingaensis]|uniref:1,2-oxophytodienoate reductase n=1 Tax=Streptomyces caatingaensis TaxID=1678637 RepID=A0A0K9XIY0_9ACTN|nr:alkene reductase [Streptomyces caatingaensis]KNB53320.1 1,2-oxophytodienoate reductase [Streptomyces caatingaensis]